MNASDQTKQQTLRDKILSLPSGSVIFRSDYPEYHAEFVGGTIVRAIAERDHAKVMPTGVTVLNALGLSTQVPMKYTYLTTGSKRVIKMKGATVTLKTAVPRYFCYETKLVIEQIFIITKIYNYYEY